ncbi:unnamed protein product [Dibothriocephalus latus]|uniref:G-protein coupled receptors family 1 profile domain-containing protein n=1 Tax=Dibothriocephalus latus TaxID=60516 RepID=A0A3P6TEA9_DIBLA|nr:unnamed protein product [Dibothriocephalus latus]
MSRSSHQRVLLMIAVAWFWSLMWSSPPFYGFGRYIPDGLQTSCSFDYLAHNVNNYIHVAGMLFCGLPIPVGIISFCYIRIIQVIKRSIRSLLRVSASSNFNSMHPRGAHEKSVVQVAKMSAITISILLISWLPYSTLAILSLSGYRTSLTPISVEMAIILAKSHPLWKPMAFIFMNERFRARLVKRVSCLTKFYKARCVCIIPAFST